DGPAAAPLRAAGLGGYNNPDQVLGHLRPVRGARPRDLLRGLAAGLTLLISAQPGSEIGVCPAGTSRAVMSASVSRRLIRHAWLPETSTLAGRAIALKLLAVASW